MVKKDVQKIVTDDLLVIDGNGNKKIKDDLLEKIVFDSTDDDPDAPFTLTPVILADGSAARKLGLNEAYFAGGGSILPQRSAPTEGIVQNGARAFGWVDAAGLTYLDAEYKLQNGAWLPCTGNPQAGLGNGVIPVGKMQVRYKSIPAQFRASNILSNETEFSEFVPTVDGPLQVSYSTKTLDMSTLGKLVAIQSTNQILFVQQIPAEANYILSFRSDEVGCATGMVGVSENDEIEDTGQMDVIVGLYNNDTGTSSFIQNGTGVGFSASGGQFICFRRINGVHSYGKNQNGTIYWLGTFDSTYNGIEYIKGYIGSAGNYILSAELELL